MVSSYMGCPILYAHLIWNHFTAAFLRYGTLFDLEGYKDTISNKYKKWMVSSYIVRKERQDSDAGTAEVYWDSK